MLFLFSTLTTVAGAAAAGMKVVDLTPFAEASDILCAKRLCAKKEKGTNLRNLCLDDASAALGFREASQTTADENVN